jgi:acetyltransferase-like isoleucine patch superfamily enzyme
MKLLLKAVFEAFCLAAAFPLALLSGFGRFAAAFRFFAHACALAPGIPGDYLRLAFYRQTLAGGCARQARIEFGSFFAHPEARLGHSVYIGSYCILGRTTIGERTQIASGVQILSGSRQHGRDSQGRMLSSDLASFETISIGRDCWIGAGAIVMAPVGEGSTIGAGSVVTRPIPAHAVAVGSPARVLD